jgi:uncharacterized protein YecT (DUF1311 family)
MTQLEINICAGKQLEPADARLNETLTTARPIVEAQALTLGDFEELERLVRESRDQMERYCRFLYGRFIEKTDGTSIREHGTMAPMLFAACLVTYVDELTNDLRFRYLPFGP